MMNRRPSANAPRLRAKWDAAHGGAERKFPDYHFKIDGTSYKTPVKNVSRLTYAEIKPTAVPGTMALTVYHSASGDTVRGAKIYERTGNYWDLKADGERRIVSKNKFYKFY